MVRIDPKRVPEIFIRNDIDKGDATRMHHLSPQIPIIDFAMLREGSQEELLKLDMACKDWGFFQPSSVQDLQSITKAFGFAANQSKLRDSLLREKWSNERYKSVEHRVVANKIKVRSVHEVILTPSTEKIVEPNSLGDGDLVNLYLQRRGSTN
ncbi:hypothetical protein RIF29_24184 [Crotalaria pallida]|uniref:Uncharacterized protein n=1 Tax=Crotalaria pallida TaxID=3830 RepID=A0AAN9ERH0_CROPI